MERAARLGVFGGTFDPPHLGHLVAASDACQVLALDRVLWVPSAVPPHKVQTVQASARDRLAMVRAAVEGDPRFEVESLELERSGPSYTVDTLRTLGERHSGAALFFLTGADNVAELPGWHRPDEILRLARLVVITRAGDHAHVPAAWNAEVVRITRVDVSATEIRRRVAAGETIRYLVPEAVRAYIERAGLYGAIPV
jgi:nicotinate-nucleotide adenylyltransferase